MRCTKAKHLYLPIIRKMQMNSKMPELDFSSPLSTAAFAMLVLLEYDESPENTIEMLNVLKGPQPMNGMDVQFCVTESRAGDIFLAHILRVHP